MDQKEQPERKFGFYTIDGIELPSVTFVLDETLRKRGLEFWLGKVGHSKAKKVSAEASSFGSAMHKIVARCITEGEKPETESAEINKAFSVWYDWTRTQKALFADPPAMIEKVIHSETYAGTCDFCSANGVLIDWKFSNRLYPSNTIQLGAYAQIVQPHEAWLVRIARGADDIEILRLDKEAFMEAAEIFNKLVDVFWYLQNG